jgi:hypothetical protein
VGIDLTHLDVDVDVDVVKGFHPATSSVEWCTTAI